MYNSGRIVNLFKTEEMKYIVLSKEIYCNITLYQELMSDSNKIFTVNEAKEIKVPSGLDWFFVKYYWDFGVFSFWSYPIGMTFSCQVSPGLAFFFFFIVIPVRVILIFFLFLPKFYGILVIVSSDFYSNRL